MPSCNAGVGVHAGRKQMHPHSILEHTAHRPWPLQAAPWAMQMRWRDLAFLHWPVAPALLRPLIPAGLELDTFEGDAWVGVVPFWMDETRMRWAPPVPTTYRFSELNVRTYVRSRDRTGIWFFSLDATSKLAVRAARVIRLPYFDAKISNNWEGSAIHYVSRRTGRRDPPAIFDAVYQPVGEVQLAAPGTLDHWLTERYCLFTASSSGKIAALDVHHLPWPLQQAEAAIEHNSMAFAAGIRLPDTAAIVHFARDLEVLAWAPRSIVS